MQTECKKLLKSKKKTFSNAAHIFDAGGVFFFVFFFEWPKGQQLGPDIPDIYSRKSPKFSLLLS